MRSARKKILALACAVCALVLLGGAARAQVSVTPTVGFDGLLYSYNYSVVNLTGFDLSIVSLNVLPRPDAVLNPMAPAGFLINFDPGVGLVSFIEGAQAFTAGTTVSGFTFQSSFAPSPSQFEAVDVAGNTLTGPTLGPNNVPEPGTLLLGLTVAPGLLFVSRRRRQR